MVFISWRYGALKEEGVTKLLAKADTPTVTQPYRKVKPSTLWWARQDTRVVEILMEGVTPTVAAGELTIAVDTAVEAQVI